MESECSSLFKTKNMLGRASYCLGSESQNFFSEIVLYGRNEHRSFSKPGIGLVEPAIGWGQGIGGIVASDPEIPTLLTIGAMVIIPKAALGSVCVSFMQYCLNNFPPT